MLKQIHIKNYAIIQQLELKFSKGLNILTGETGAGKSIIVDAIQLVIGSRASSDMIRHGESKAIIECLFNVEGMSHISEFLNNFDFDGKELTIRREISSRGNSRCFVNDTPTTVNHLKELGQLLVDFHGQHEHQSLLDATEHIHIVDAFADSRSLIQEYYERYGKLKNAIDEYKSMIRRKKELSAKIELIKQQNEEINKIAPKIGEDEEIESELKKAENAEYLVSLASELNHIFMDADHSCYNQLNHSKKIIEKLSEYEPQFDEFAAEIEPVVISIKEISSFAKDFARNIEFNPTRIEHLRKRYADLKKLMKKFGSIDDILDLLENNNQSLDLISQFADRSDELIAEIEKLSVWLGDSARKLHSLRSEKSKLMSLAVVDKLRELGIENADFQVKFKTEICDNKNIITDSPTAIIDNKLYKATANGIDKAEFLISANKGTEPRPLAETASGGEISRVMLAIKSILAGKDKVPLMVFDEIDTGISGRIAQKVGFNMKQLAGSRQIIAITHLPQIAALGDMNISVAKYSENGNTFAQAIVLDNEQKKIEIAKLISGEIISDSAIESAEKLINPEIKYE